MLANTSPASQHSAYRTLLLRADCATFRTIKLNSNWSTVRQCSQSEWMAFRQPGYSILIIFASVMLLESCASYGPFHADTATNPHNSIRGPEDGRYKMAFIEFGDQGSPLDNYQRRAALEMIHEARRPLLFVYIHGWQNNATSSDVCRFEHFLDSVSRSAAFTGRNIDVRGVYVAWRGRTITAPGLEFFTFWDRKSAGESIAAANSCLSTLQELAVVAREPGKEFHRTVLLGHSFGALVLGNAISHSILGSNSPWDMAVAFNSAASSVNTRQLMQELDYYYKYDPQQRMNPRTP
jgi:hypothetical protein